MWQFLRNRQLIRTVFVTSTLLFILAFVCFATSSSPFSDAPNREKREVASEIVGKTKPTKSECPIEAWNTVETDEIPHLASPLYIKFFEEKTPLFHPALLGAFLLDKYILVMIDTQGLAGRPVFCRYFDCLRREIPNQFESRIHPESVVYCPRRVGAVFISISGNVSERRSDLPIPIENRFKQSPSSTTVEVQINHSMA